MVETRQKLHDKPLIRWGAGSLLFSGGLAVASILSPSLEIDESKINKLNSDIEKIEQDLSEYQKAYIELIEKPDLPIILPDGSFLPNTTEDLERLGNKIDKDETLKIHGAIVMLENQVYKETNRNEHTLKNFLEIGSACLAGAGVGLMLTNYAIEKCD